MKFTSLAVAASAAAFFVAVSPAQAATCLTDNSAPEAIDCRGYFSGNLIRGEESYRDTQLTALQEMGFTGAVPASLFSSPFKIDLNEGDSVAFPTDLYGLTFIGIHWGGKGGGQSAIYKFNFTDVVSAIEILAKNPGGSSNAVLYGTQVYTPPPPAVPEPATWAMMIGGLGIVGIAMRRRSTRVSFA